MRTDFEKYPSPEEEDGSLSDELRPKRIKKLPGETGATPPPVIERQEGFRLWAELLRNFALVMTLAGVPLLLVVGLTISIWLGSGVPSLRAARHATINAEDEYHRELRSSQRLIGLLASLGSPQAQLEALYFAFEDAPADVQRRMGDQYLGVLVDQLNVVATTPGELPTQARELVQPALAARSRTHQSYQQWRTLLDTPKGWALTVLWVVTPPPLGMEIYEKPNSRKLLPPVNP